MKTLLKNTMIVTQDKERTIIPNGFLEITDDRITAIGDMKDCISTLNHEIIDLVGNVIFPGFVNIHTHAALSVLRGIGDDLGIAPAYSQKVPQGVYMSQEDIFSFSMLGGAEALKFGSTTIVDNYIHELQAANAFDQLGLRAFVSERIHDADLFKIPNGQYEYDLEQGMRLLQQNVDLIVKYQDYGDGRINTMIGPHATDTCSPNFMKEICRAKNSFMKSIVIHLSQSKSEIQQIKNMCDLLPTEYLYENGIMDCNLIAGHCIFVNDREIELIHLNDSTVSHQSGSNSKGGMCAPIYELKEKGVRIGLGTDNMAGDMIEVMRLALISSRMRTQTNSLFAQDVLDMATLGGACALGMQSEIGSLEVGKKADLVIINFRKPHLYPLLNPVMNLVHNGSGNDVQTVFVNGRKTVENGSLLLVDEDEILNDSQMRCKNLWQRFN